MKTIGTLFLFAYTTLFFSFLPAGNTAISKSGELPVRSTELKMEDVAKIATGMDFTLYLRSDGVIFSFGSNNYGQLGQGDTEGRLYPTVIESADYGFNDKNIIDIAAKGLHAMALADDGTLYTWGSGTGGALGHGDTNNQLTPKPITSTAFGFNDKTITSIEAGSGYSLALASDGTVFSFGENGTGKLGHGDKINRLEPTPITSTAFDFHTYTITEMAAGITHTLLLADDGTVFSFGHNAFGELGHGDLNERLVPTPITSTSDGFNDKTIIAISAHGHTVSSQFEEFEGGHSLALASDGTVYSFGSGFWGQLGHGDSQDQLLPKRIDSTNDGFNTKTITVLAAGHQHSVLLASDGSLYTFGQGPEGRLGLGETTSANSPSLITSEAFGFQDSDIIGIAASHIYTMALSGDDTLYSFGRGSGNGDLDIFFERKVPTPVNQGEPEGIIIWHQEFGHERTGTSVAVSPVLIAHNGAHDTILEFTSGHGSNHNHFFYLDDGYLYTHQQLPVGSYFIRLRASNASGVLEESFELKVVPGMVASVATAGYNHSIAISADGKVYAFGRNENGSLGLGDEDVRLSPVLIDSDTDDFNSKIFHIAVAGLHTTLLVATDGSVYTFGNNEEGQLGHGDLTNRNIPRKIQYTSHDFNNKHFVRAAAGDEHFLLIASDGTLFSMGYNFYGQLGLGHTNSRTRPSPIESMQHGFSEMVMTSIAAGHGHSLALAHDGSVYTFGRGDQGALGHGNTSNSHIPKKISSQAFDFNQKKISHIAAGTTHSVVTATDGTVYTFGTNWQNELGHGDGGSLSDQKETPTLIQSVQDDFDSKVIIAGSAGRHTILLSDDNTVFTFGRGFEGQLGHGNTGMQSVPKAIESTEFDFHNQTFVSIAAGGSGRGASGNGFSLILSDDGTLYTFGIGAHGQTGHGNMNTQLIPKPIDGFSLGVAPLPAPELISPADESIHVSPRPFLSWEPVTGADTYDIQVFEDEFLLQSAFSIQNVDETVYRIPELNHNHTYYWRIRASTNAGPSLWSEPWSFTTTQSGLPFFENFDDLPFTNSMPDGWNVENNFTFTDFYYGSSTGAVSEPNAVFNTAAGLMGFVDNWFFLPGLYLEEGVSYEFSFWYALSVLKSTLNEVRVYIGTNQSSGGINPEPILEITGINNRDPLRAGVSFTVEEDGVYFFGVHQYKPSVTASHSSTLSFDDIRVRKAPQYFQNNSVVPDTGVEIPFVDTGLYFTGNVITGGDISFEYFDYPPIPGELPVEIESTMEFFLEASSENVDFNEGVVALELSQIQTLMNLGNAVWLKREFAGQPWVNIGGELVEGRLQSTVPFDSFSEFTVGGAKEELPLTHHIQITGTHEGWRMLGSPVKNTSYRQLFSSLWTQGFGGTANPDVDSNVYWYDELTNTWTSPSHIDNIIGTSVSEGVGSEGRASIIWIYEDDNFDGKPNGWPKNISVFGFPNTGAVERGLSYTSANGSSAGWHLVSNPYPFSISWPDLVDSNDLHQISETVQIWNPNQNNGLGSYRSNPGIRDHGLPEELSFDGDIGPFQAFWVRAVDAGASVTFRESHRSDSEPGLKSSSQNQMLSFKLSNGELSDFLAVQFTSKEAPVPGFQPFSLSHKYLQLYSMDAGGSPVTIWPINTEYPSEVSIPVYINTTDSGTYTLTWNGLGLPDYIQVIVTDSQTGFSFDISELDSYLIEIETSLKRADISKNRLPVKVNSAGEQHRLTLTIINLTETSAPTENELPADYSLMQNYPNPFNPETTIRYSLPEAAHARLEIYDLLGRRAAILVNSYQQPGFHQVRFNAASLASGLYIYRLTAGGFTQTRKMMVVK